MRRKTIMGGPKISLFITFGLLVGLAGCFEDFTEDLTCKNCLPCEECIPSDDGAYCQAPEHQYQQCGEDGDIHWFDACDVEEELALACLNGECINSSKTEGYCECLNHWEGMSCDQCPANWDPNKYCAECAGAWIDENNDCGTCAENGNMDDDCMKCVGNWDINTDCKTCKYHWIDEDNNCGTCPGNWDPTEDCNACIGFWDPDENCEMCIGENEPNVVFCGNGLVQGTEECDDCNNEDWDGCNSCEIAEFMVATSGDTKSIAMGSDGHFIITWSAPGNYPDYSNVYFRRYGTDGLPMGEQFRVNTDIGGEHEYARASIGADGRFVVAWCSHMGGSANDIYARLFNSDGTPMGGQFLANESTYLSQIFPSVAMDANGRFIVAWTTYDGGIQVVARHFDVDGSPISGEFPINSAAGSNVWTSNPYVVVDSNGSFLMSWEADDYARARGILILARRFDNDAVPIEGSEFLVSVSSILDELENPNIAINSTGQFVITWQHGFSSIGVSAKLFTPEGVSVGEEFKSPMHDNSAGNPFFSSSASIGDDGEFVVAWNDGETYSEDYGVFVQRFNSDATTNGEVIAASSYTDHHVISHWDFPSTAMTPDGRFVVVWAARIDRGIYAQRYDADGNPLGILSWDHFQE